MRNANDKFILVSKFSESTSTVKQLFKVKKIIKEITS